MLGGRRVRSHQGGQRDAFQPAGRQGYRTKTLSSASNRKVHRSPRMPIEATGPPCPRRTRVLGDEPRRPVGAIACKRSLHRLDIAADAVMRDVWARFAVSGDRRPGPGRPVGRQDCVKTVEAAAGVVHPDRHAQLPAHRVRGLWLGGGGGGRFGGRASSVSSDRSPPQRTGAAPSGGTRLDPRQSSLAPPRFRPVLEGVFVHTRLGWVAPSVGA